MRGRPRRNCTAWQTTVRYKRITWMTKRTYEFVCIESAADLRSIWFGSQNVYTLGYHYGWLDLQGGPELSDAGVMARLVNNWNQLVLA